MHISRVQLVNFRNFERADAVFNKGVNTIIGENGSLHVAIVERAVSAHPIDLQQSTAHRSFTYLVTRHLMKVSPSRAAAEFWRDLPKANGRAPFERSSLLDSHK